MEKILKGKTVTWGSTGVQSAGTIVEDFTGDDIVKEETVEDNDGFTVTTILLPDGEELKFTVVADATYERPDIGDEITIDGTATCLVTGRGRKKVRKGVATFTVAAKKYNNLGS
jgi:hypothetical protein